MFDKNNNPTGVPPANVPTQEGDKSQNNNRLGIDDLNNGKQYPFKKVTPPGVIKPNTAEDIFADADDKKQPDADIIKPLGQQQPIQQQKTQPPIQPQTDMPPGLQPMKTQKKGKLLTIIIIILVAAFLGLAAYWASSAFLNKNSNSGFDDLMLPQGEDGNLNDILNDLSDDLNTDTNTQDEINNNDIKDETNEVDEEKPPFVEEEPEVEKNQIDTDADGLTDDEELSWGTNPNRVDTDFDGLSDYEEVNIYATSPVNADSDNDTYLDGVEVENGFDPLGPGKLQ